MSIFDLGWPWPYRSSLPVRPTPGLCAGSNTSNPTQIRSRLTDTRPRLCSVYSRTTVDCQMYNNVIWLIAYLQFKGDLTSECWYNCQPINWKWPRTCRWLCRQKSITRLTQICNHSTGIASYLLLSMERWIQYCVYWKRVAFFADHRHLATMVKSTTQHNSTIAMRLTFLINCDISTTFVQESKFKMQIGSVFYLWCPLANKVAQSIVHITGTSHYTHPLYTLSQ